MRVLLLHNRYRDPGGEERLVETIESALESHDVECRLLARDSAGLGRFRAAAGMLAGGLGPKEVEDAVREFKPQIVHVHNINPLFGYRSLVEARRGGARVVMHLHNFRLFCSIGTSYRDGRPCFRCRGRNTGPGVRLRCRGGLVESAVYGIALSAYQQRVVDSTDLFIAPSRFAADRLSRLGLPEDRLKVLPNPFPGDALVERSTADRGQYALFVGRLSGEKGIGTAIEAAVVAGVPLKVAGAGPEEERCRELAGSDGRVEFLGRVDRATLTELRSGAALALIPSRGPEVFPFAALEAMASGLPVLASRIGGLPEMVGEENTLTPGDVDRWAAAIESIMTTPKERKRLGKHNLNVARDRYGEEVFAENLLEQYREAVTTYTLVER